MIKVTRIQKESRQRDLKRNRLLVQLGKTRLHITQTEAIQLRDNLNAVLPSNKGLLDVFIGANRFFKNREEI